MKLIISAWGTVFLHAAADDVCPPNGILQRDLVETVGAAYAFSGKPIIPPGTPPQMFPILTFQEGKFLSSSDNYSIQQINIYPNGDAVTAATTEIADIVLEEYLKMLDSHLGYRYGNRKWKRTYASGMVVQFDFSIEEKIAVFEKIGRILDKAAPREGNPFKPKTLTFGFGDPVQQAALNSIDAASVADFILQRRAGEPYSSNRYFSSAPLQTTDHLKMLEAIEAAILE